jgi:hypothetical protein
MSAPELGRLPAAEVKEPVVMDQPSMVSQAILTKLDECIDRLNAISTAVETATDAATLFAALDVAEIKSEIQKLKFFI